MQIYVFYYNFLLFLKKLYNFIKDLKTSKRNLNSELIEINKIIIKLNKLSKENNKEIFQFYAEIIKDKFASKIFKDYALNISLPII